MKRFYVGSLCEGIEQVVSLERRFACQSANGSSLAVSQADLEEAQRVISWLSDFTYKTYLGFAVSFNKLQHSHSYIFDDQRPFTAAGLEAEFRNIKEALLTDIGHDYFLRVEEDRFSFAENPKLLGSKVLVSFPQAGADIREAGNCLAAECNTAAVFHLLRVAEWGMRGLCLKFKLIRIPRRRKPGKKIRHLPIEYAQWEDLLNHIRIRIDEMIDKMPKGPKKQKEQEFYYSVLDELEGFRDAFRNHVMHTRAFYSREDAFAVFTHVKRMMAKLSDRIVMPDSEITQ